MFIGHSMGGLMIKEILATASMLPDAKAQDLFRNTKAVLYYATPHHSPPLAQSTGVLQTLLGGHPATKDLYNQVYLEALNSKVAQFHHIASLSVAEGSPMYVGGGLSAMAVPEDCAYPGFGQRTRLPGYNHHLVCKPRDRDDPRYMCALDFVTKLVADRQNQKGPENSKVPPPPPQ